jgi:hypothetical protein
MYKVFGAESCSGGDTHQPAAAAAGAASQVALSQPIKIPINQFPYPSSVFYKQGGGATVLREAPDTVVRETCLPTSFSECKQFRKSSCAAFCLSPLLPLGPCQTQPVDH